MVTALHVNAEVSAPAADVAAGKHTLPALSGA